MVMQIEEREVENANSLEEVTSEKLDSSEIEIEHFEEEISSSKKYGKKGRSFGDLFGMDVEDEEIEGELQGSPHKFSVVGHDLLDKFHILDNVYLREETGKN